MPALQGWSFDGDYMRKLMQPNQYYGFFLEKILPPAVGLVFWGRLVVPKRRPENKIVF